MENDNASRAEQMIGHVNQLLEVSVKNLRDLVEYFIEVRSGTMPSTDQECLDGITDICSNLACKVSTWHERVFPTSVPWLPDDPVLLNNMIFLKGESPWSFVLTYPEARKLDLFNDPSETPLQQFYEIPEPGTFLFCLYHKKYFRGLLLEIISKTRVKVMDIDSNELFLVPKTAVYRLPDIFSKSHAFSLHCCILDKDDFIEALWTKELEGMFVRTLKECSLHVEILEACSENPNKYLVNLICTNNDGFIVNLSDWFHNILIPDIKQIYPLLRDKNDLTKLLKDESLEPFFIIQSKQINIGINSGKLQGKNPFLLCSASSTFGSIASCSARNSCCPSLFDDKETKYKNPFTLENNLTSDPKIHQKMLNKENPPDFGHCSSFALTSYCFDPKCRMVHVYKGKKLVGEREMSTDGSVLSLEILNKIKLPNINERVNVIITHVISATSFYVILEEKYSVIKENGLCESYTTTINRMNDSDFSACYKPLVEKPTVGILVAFRSELTQGWARGVVTDVGRSNVCVVNPDIGRSAIVSISELRTVQDHDKVLPAQAVLTCLYDITLVPGMEKKCKEYFIDLTCFKEMQTVVKQANPLDSTMEVELFTSEGVNINQALVQSGLCKRVNVDNAF